VTPSIIWLSVISMTSDMGDFMPIITPFKEEAECEEKTEQAVAIFEQQIQAAEGEWETHWDCQFFSMNPIRYGF